MIHPSAIVDPEAWLDAAVRVGPWAVIGPGVEIGAGCEIGSHAVILGPTRIGSDNVIHGHAQLGDSPQDLSYRGEPTRLEIGTGNIVREFVTMHRGTPKGRGVTRIGNGCMFMAYSHVGHDCDVDDGVILANGVMLGGHVELGEHVNIGGLSAVHQLARIGRYAMVGGCCAVRMDIPPYAMASGSRARLHGLNRRGLERAGFTPESVHALKHAWRVLFRSGLRRTEAAAVLREAGEPTPEVAHLLDFLESSRRGVTR